MVTRCSRNGISLIEVLVCLGVIGLLLAMLLPAVQESRAISLRFSCLNNLHQIGIATPNYTTSRDGGLPGYKSGSPFVELAPYLEMALPEGQASLGVQFPVLLCPVSNFEQTSSRDFQPLRTSYLLNGGTLFDHRNGLSAREYEPSRESAYKPIRNADITDGMSQTALFSERLFHEAPSGSITGMASRADRFIWHTTTRYQIGDEARFQSHCLDPAYRITPLPEQFAASRPIRALHYPYTHLLPPNHASCFWRAISTPSPYETGLVTATSQHKGGVNVVMCDGHGRFVSNSIDLRVWGALGTRNGNDVVGDY